MELIVRSGSRAGTRIAIRSRPFSIGRDQHCDLVLDDPRASRRHATLEVAGDDEAMLIDLESINGTFVDGQRVEGRATVRAGQAIRIGDTELEVEADPSVAAGGSAADTVFGVAAPATAVTPTGEAPTPPTPPPPAAPAPPPPPAEPAPITISSHHTRWPMIAAGVGVVAVVLLILAVTGVLPPDRSGTADRTASTDDTSGPTTVALPKTVEQVVAESTPSVVSIQTSSNGSPISGGSGWVLDAGKGQVVTNAHVVNGGDSFEVGVNGDLRSAELIGVAPCEDLAVLRLKNRNGLRTMPLGSQEDVRLGQQVVALGFPASASNDNNLTATGGLVSVKQTRFDVQAVDVPNYPNVIQTDAAINPGNSGGPLVDLEGRLVGVNSAGINVVGGRTIQNEGYAIGVDQVKKIVSDLRAGDSLGWTGLGLDYPTPTDLRGAGLPVRDGLLITEVVPGTPAEAANLGRRPALIVSIDGRPMDGTLPGYCRVVGDKKGGSQVTLQVIAPGSTTVQAIRLRLA